LLANPDLTMPEALQSLFPENSGFIVAIVNFGIIIALIGTIHSMIWGLGALMLSYLKFLHNKTLQNYIRQGYINQNLYRFIVWHNHFNKFYDRKNIRDFL